MASYKAVLNPFTGNLTLIRADSAFHLKDNVSSYANLPLTGNSENDVRITSDTDKMYTWGISASSGLLTDWKEIGSATAVDWSAITGKPSSTPAQIDGAVSANHTQGTDQKLDDGGANEVSVADVKDAVTKKHTQNTDNTIELTEAPSSDHTATGVKCDFTAGESVVFGEVCYIKSDGKMWKADADAEATSYCIAIALESISADASGSFLLIGVARDDSWAWTVGSPIYLSTTAGAMTQTAPSGSGDIVQILGIATHADRVYFKPDLVQVEIA